MSIVLESVNYIYSEDSNFRKQALKDVSVEFGENEFVALIGHTGSGKSTLVQLLNGLIKPSSGRVLYQGEDIHQKGYSKKELRRHVGLVFQYPEHQLFEDTVLRDVCYGPKNLGLSEEEQKTCAKEALSLVGLSEDIYEKSPFELSGGQKRRVAIAGVLAMNPDYLVLDEPTAGLDPCGRDEILTMLSEMHKKTRNTIILVSHSMEDVAKYAERIVVLNAGEVFCDDTPTKVFAKYRELEEIGLAAPQITYIMNELYQQGFAVDVTATTLQEGRDSLLKALQLGRNA